MFQTTNQYIYIYIMYVHVYHYFTLLILIYSPSFLRSIGLAQHTPASDHHQSDRRAEHSPPADWKRFHNWTYKNEELNNILQYCICFKNTLNQYQKSRFN